MKKFLMIFLCIALMFTFVACNKDNSKNDETSAPEETKIEAENKETEKDTTEETTIEEPETAFDTSWASNDYEKLIPQPPMEIARSYENEGKWVITNLISNSNPANDPKWPVSADVAKEDVLSYIDQLRTLGFVEKSEIYENKTEVQEVMAAFFKTPDEKYSVTVWYEDNYILNINIQEIPAE